VVLLTRREADVTSGRHQSEAAAPKSLPGVAGFKSERWPTSNRNVDRLQAGRVADIKSERVAGLRRNLQRSADQGVAGAILPDFSLGVSGSLVSAMLVFEQLTVHSQRLTHTFLDAVHLRPCPQSIVRSKSRSRRATASTTIFFPRLALWSLHRVNHPRSEERSIVATRLSVMPVIFRTFR
jgi:hypothetical protein